MADATAMWHAEHADYSRLLDVVEEEVSAFHEGRRPDYSLMLDAVSYLRHFPDRFHHPREDVAFARLVQRDPSRELPINRLLQEHRVIAAAGEELLKRLTEVAKEHRSRTRPWRRLQPFSSCTTGTIWPRRKRKSCPVPRSC